MLKTPAALHGLGSRAARLTRLARDQRGVSAIEFALIAPIMILMFFGMTELSQALIIQRRASHGDSAIGDVVSQYANPAYNSSGVAQGTAPVNPAITPSSMNDIFVAGDLIMAPYPTTPLETRVTSVVVDSQGKARVNWSCISTPTSTTKYMTAPQTAVTDVTSSVPSGMLNLTAPVGAAAAAGEGDSVIEAESYYPYTSPVQYVLKTPITFKNTYYFKPRATTTVVGFYPGTTATAWNMTWDSSSVATSLTSSGVTCSYQTG